MVDAMRMLQDDEFNKYVRRMGVRCWVRLVCVCDENVKAMLRSKWLPITSRYCNVARQTHCVISVSGWHIRSFRLDLFVVVLIAFWRDGRTDGSRTTTILFVFLLTTRYRVCPSIILCHEIAVYKHDVCERTITLLGSALITLCNYLLKFCHPFYCLTFYYFK